jgi:hypothetical protein
MFDVLFHSLSSYVSFFVHVSPTYYIYSLLLFSTNFSSFFFALNVFMPKWHQLQYRSADTEDFAFVAASARQTSPHKTHIRRDLILHILLLSILGGKMSSTCGHTNIRSYFRRFAKQAKTHLPNQLFLRIKI